MSTDYQIIIYLFTIFYLLICRDGGSEVGASHTCSEVQKSGQLSLHNVHVRERCHSSEEHSCTTSINMLRQRTCSGNSRVQRQRSFKRTGDEEKLKRSRAWANAYELSQDLHDKQLEMLERKYGGHSRSRRAALVIQQAFRQYSMTKNFEKMRSNSTCSSADKRLSLRLSEYNRSSSAWLDIGTPENSYGFSIPMSNTVGGDVLAPHNRSVPQSEYNFDA